MKFKLCLAILLLLLSSSFGADRWQSFSSPFPINDAVAYGEDGVFLATDGGLRFRTPTHDFVFHAENGLEDSDINAVVSSDLGIFVISEYGIVSTMREDGVSWRVLSRAFTDNKSSVVSGAATMADNILVIGFEDRLSFFVVDKGYSVLTIDRIRNNILSVNRIQKVHARGDSLYVQLVKGTYVRPMDWKSIESDIRLADPDSWIEVPEKQVISGMEPWDSLNVVVEGENLKDSILFKTMGVWDSVTQRTVLYQKSRINKIVKTKKGHFLVGSDCLYFYDGKKITDLSFNKDFPLYDAYEVRAFPGGGAYAASSMGEFSYHDGQGWHEPINTFVGSMSTGVTSRLKDLAYLPDGHLLFHVWGMEFYGYSNWGTRMEFDISASHGTCLDLFLGTYYIIAISIIPAPDNSGFLTVTGSDKGYSLVYITKDGDVHCVNQIGNTVQAAPLHAEIGENGHWIVYVGTRDGGSLSSDGWMDIFEFPSPKSNGGEISNVKKTVVKGSNQAIIDMVYDTKQSRLWMVTNSTLLYYDDSRDTLIQPTSIKGMRGVEFSAIDMDPHGNLWVGTAENGAFRLTQQGKTPDTLLAKNFSSRDGMLSNRVSDVAVDAVLGRIWFAHDRGVSYLERGELRDASSFMTDSAKAVRAYPIPFRPKIHSFFTLDNIDENALVSIFNRGGSLIRSFRNEEIVGGRLQWDGRGKDGRLVAPGVYYYVIKNSSKSEKGKFIIVH